MLPSFTSFFYVTVTSKMEKWLSLVWQIMIFFFNFLVPGRTEMGASKKWIKALLGLKKSDKSQSFENDENVGDILWILPPNTPDTVPFFEFLRLFKQVEWVRNAKLHEDNFTITGET